VALSATDMDGGTGTTSSTLNVIPAVPATATFLSADTTTQGNWVGVYGNGGFDIAQDTSAANPSIPSYAQVGITGAYNFTWSSTTTDVRTLRNAARTGRIEACWFSTSSFSINLNLTDGQTHRVALYAADYDGFGGGRNERIDVINNSTGTVLDSRTLSSFSGGEYLVWNLRGNVTIRVTNLNPASNAVVSGLFFG
jgi:hypothetical protein